MGVGYYGVDEDRAKQLDNYLMHYGRKGMKWGKNIFLDEYYSPMYSKGITRAYEDTGSSGSKKKSGSSKVMKKTVNTKASRNGDILEVNGIKINLANRKGKNLAERIMETIDDRSKEVGNAVSKAADDTKNWASDKAKEVGKVVSKAADDTKNWASERVNEAGDTAKKVGSAVSKAADDTKNWVGDRTNEASNTAKKVGKAVGDTAKKAGDAVGNAAKDAGNWVGNKAKDVGNAAGKAAKDVGDWGGKQVDKGKKFLKSIFG